MGILVKYLFLVGLTVQFLLVSGQDNRKFKIFQFPPDKIPRIDGIKDDWAIVDDSYAIGMDQLWDDRHDSVRHRRADPQNLDVTVKVGWVKGLNRLYFLYEAYDNYWDFELPGLHNDIFEIVVDADRSEGPFISQFHPNKRLDPMDTYFSYQGVHAQNYHIFTPAWGKDWTMVWGPQSWLKELPYANSAYDYDLKPRGPGKLTLEFWITPFDYAHASGPEFSRESVLKENQEIGLAWAVLDYDGVNDKSYNGFWNLSKVREMYGDATYLLPFKLMPLEKQFLPSLDARWSFTVLDEKERKVQFRDESIGKILSWEWDFGDGTKSVEPSPVHKYAKPGFYVVTLWVTGPEGKSRRAKVWDLTLR
jgi:hypothetical protein